MLQAQPPLLQNLVQSKSTHTSLLRDIFFFTQFASRRHSESCEYMQMYMQYMHIYMYTYEFTAT